MIFDCKVSKVEANKQSWNDCTLVWIRNTWIFGKTSKAITMHYIGLFYFNIEFSKRPINKPHVFLLHGWEVIGLWSCGLNGRDFIDATVLPGLAQLGLEMDYLVQCAWKGVIINIGYLFVPITSIDLWNLWDMENTLQIPL